MNSRVSGDGGTTWTLEGQVIASGAVGRAIVCDPSYLSSDGVFVLKTTDAVAAMRRARVEPEGAVLPRPGGA